MNSIKNILILIFIYTFFLWGCKNKIVTAQDDFVQQKNEVLHNKKTTLKTTDIIIDSDKIRQLITVGVPVIMPNYIPDGFQLTNFNADIRTPENDNIADSTGHYEAIYQGANRCHFGIEGSEASWGDYLDGSQQWIINTKILGEVTLMHIYGGSSGKPELQAWVIPDEKEVIKGFPYASYRFYFICQNSLFSPKEAARIIESVKIQ